MRPFSFLLAAVMLLTLSAVSYGHDVEGPDLITVAHASEHAAIDTPSVTTPVLQTHRADLSRTVPRSVYSPRRKYSRTVTTGKKPCRSPWKKRDYGNTLESMLAAHAARVAEARARDRANDRR